MKVHLTSCLLVVLGFLLPVSAATFHSGTETEASGSDYSGSGDGDDFVYKREDHNHRNEVRKDLTLDRPLWPAMDSDVILLPSRESFFSNSDVVTAVAAGGVVGATLAVFIATFLILKWRRMEKIISRRRSTNRDRLILRREEYVV